MEKNEPIEDAEWSIEMLPPVIEDDLESFSQEVIDMLLERVIEDERRTLVDTCYNDGAGRVKND